MINSKPVRQALITLIVALCIVCVGGLIIIGASLESDGSDVFDHNERDYRQRVADGVHCDYRAEIDCGKWVK